MTLTCQWRTICEVKQLIQMMEHRVHKHQPQTQIRLTLMVRLLFRTPREVYPVQLVLLVQVTTDIHNHPTKDWVRRLPSII